MANVLAGRRLGRSAGKKRLRPYERTQIRISLFVLIVVTLLSMFPIYYVLMTSVNYTNGFPAGLTPMKPTLDHFRYVLNPNNTDLLVWIRNTLIVGVITGAIQVVVVTLLSYAFSRFRFPGRRYGMMALLGFQIFPAVIFLSAQYYLVNWVSEHWFQVSENWIGVILIYAGTGIPYLAWLYKGYIDTLPFDLEEAAYIDGASKFRAFRQVILPLCRPMMAVTFIYTFIGVANEYLLISVLVTSPSRKTFSYGLFTFVTGQFETQWSNFAAAAVIGSIPLVVLFLVAQRWLVSGLASGAVKG